MKLHRIVWSEPKRCVSIWLVLSFILIGGLARGQGNTASPAAAADTSLKGQAERKISELLGVTVSVADFKLDYTTARLIGVKIGDPSQPRLPLAEAQELSATCNLMSLIGGNLVLEDISIASLSGRLTRSASGSLVLGDIPVPAPAPGSIQPEVFPFQKLRGSSLELHLSDEGLSRDFTLRLPSLEAEKTPDGKGLVIGLTGIARVSQARKNAIIAELPFKSSFEIRGNTLVPASGSTTLGPTTWTALQTLGEAFLPASSRLVDFQGGTAEAGFDITPQASATPALGLWIRIRGTTLTAPAKGLKIRNLSGDLTFTGSTHDGVLDGKLLVADLHGSIGNNDVPVSLGSMGMKIEGLGSGTGRILVEDTDLKVMETPIHISGTISPGETPQILMKALSILDLAALHRTLPGGKAGFRDRTTLSGKAAVTIVISGPLRDPAVSADISLSADDFTFREKKVALKDVHASIRAERGVATIKEFTAVSAGGNLSASGTLRNVADPVIALSGSIRKAATSQVLSALKAVFPTIPPQLEFSGTSDIDFSAQGRAFQPKLSGTARFQGGEISLPVLGRPVTHVQGAVQLDNRGLRTEKLDCRWGTSEARVSGKVEDLGAFRMALSFSVKHFDLTDTAGFLLSADSLRISGKGEASGMISGPPRKLNVEGSVRIPSGIVSAPISATDKSPFSFPYKDLSSRFRLAGNVFSFQEGQAEVFGGTLKGKGSVDPGKTPIGFEFHATGSGLRVESFLAENTSQKHVVTGPADGELQVSGNVSGLSSWNGKGNVKMVNGKYEAPPVVTPILSALNLKQFASGNLTGVDGSFLLGRGMMTTEDLTFVAPVGKAFYKGEVGLDTRLNGNLTLAFSKAAIDQSQVLREISLDGTSVTVPTKVKGTLLEPSFPGFSPGKLLELGLKRTGQKILQDAILGKPKAPEASNASAPAKADETGDLLKSLGGIFKKKSRKKSPSTAEPPKTPAASEPAKATESPGKELKKLGKELENLFKF